jgi:hypothetical protein
LDTGKDDGLLENKSLEVLDLSDNDLNNAHGIMILKFIKIQGERRDKDLWTLSLRQRRVEEHLKSLVKSLNMQTPDIDK